MFEIVTRFPCSRLVISAYRGLEILMAECVHTYEREKECIYKRRPKSDELGRVSEQQKFRHISAKLHFAKTSVYGYVVCQVYRKVSVDNDWILFNLT